MRACGVPRHQCEALRDWVFRHLCASEHSEIAQVVLALLDVVEHVSEYCPQCEVHAQTIYDLEKTLKEDQDTVQEASEALDRIGRYEDALIGIRSLAEETLDDH